MSTIEDARKKFTASIDETLRVATPQAKRSTSVSERDLFGLVQQQIEQQDRQQVRLIAGMARLNETFEKSMQGLRWELRIIVVLALLLGAARDGVFTRLGLPGVTIETHATSQVDRTGDEP